MKIINKSSNAVLAQEVILADKPIQRMVGLLGRKELEAGQALILKPCDSIHTFFMKFPIDILFVDKENKVIKIILSLKPFRLTPIYFKARFAIEFTAGAIEPTRTCEGDTLLIE